MTHRGILKGVARPATQTPQPTGSYLGTLGRFVGSLPDVVAESVRSPNLLISTGGALATITPGWASLCVGVGAGLERLPAHLPGGEGDPQRSVELDGRLAQAESTAMMQLEKPCECAEDPDFDCWHTALGHPPRPFVIPHRPHHRRVSFAEHAEEVQYPPEELPVPVDPVEPDWRNPVLWPMPERLRPRGKATQESRKLFGELFAGWVTEEGVVDQTSTDFQISTYASYLWGTGAKVLGVHRVPAADDKDDHVLRLRIGEEEVLCALKVLSRLVPVLAFRPRTSELLASVRSRFVQYSKEVGLSLEVSALVATGTIFAAMMVTDPERRTWRALNGRAVRDGLALSQHFGAGYVPGNRWWFWSQGSRMKDVFQPFSYIPGLDLATSWAGVAGSPVSLPSAKGVA